MLHAISELFYGEAIRLRLKVFGCINGLCFSEIMLWSEAGNWHNHRQALPSEFMLGNTSSLGFRKMSFCRRLGIELLFFTGEELFEECDCDTTVSVLLYYWFVVAVEDK